MNVQAAIDEHATVIREALQVPNFNPEGFWNLIEPDFLGLVNLYPPDIRRRLEAQPPIKVFRANRKPTFDLAALFAGNKLPSEFTTIRGIFEFNGAGEFPKLAAYGYFWTVGNTVFGAFHSALFPLLHLTFEYRFFSPTNRALGVCANGFAGPQLHRDSQFGGDISNMPPAVQVSMASALAGIIGTFAPSGLIDL